MTDEKAVTVELYYADGEEMLFADVTVFTLAYSAVLALHGRADGRGRIAFVPERDETWSLMANDGDDHGVNAPIPIPVTRGAATVALPRAPLEM